MFEQMERNLVEKGEVRRREIHTKKDKAERTQEKKADGIFILLYQFLSLYLFISVVYGGLWYWMNWVEWGRGGWRITSGWLISG